MSLKAECIHESVSLYDRLDLEKDLTILREGIDGESVRNSFNTIVLGTRRKETSFRIFEDIRRTEYCSAYFHIPFCRIKCGYCCYECYARSTPAYRMAYLMALEKEIILKKDILKGNLRPDIFYVGGGTPAFLNAQELNFFMDILGRNFTLSENLEFTFETTPAEVVKPEGPQAWHELYLRGVNRVNVGIQSFSEEVCRKNGRIQESETIGQSVASLREMGFKKINLDLIYGLIGQGLDHWYDDLSRAVELRPDSITTFFLRVRRGTAHFLRFLEKPDIFPSERQMIIMRMMTDYFLRQHGYGEDNSDYFLLNEEKRYMYHPFQPHNLSRNLIGFGPSAYSIAGPMQIFNTPKTQEYMQKIEGGSCPIDSSIILGEKAYMRKRLAEGLRTEFNDTVFKKDFGVSVFEVLGGVIEKLKAMGLIEVMGSTIKLSFRGRFIADDVGNHINYSSNA